MQVFFIIRSRLKKIPFFSKYITLTRDVGHNKLFCTSKQVIPGLVKRNNYKKGEKNIYLMAGKNLGV